MNFKDGQPIYIQIAERLADEILAGKYGTDERIPGVRDYSGLLGVNVNTTVRAYDLLSAQGIIYTKRGMGYFVGTDAICLIKEGRRTDFFEQHLPTIAQRMKQLDISEDELLNKLQNIMKQRPILIIGLCLMLCTTTSCVGFFSKQLGQVLDYSQSIDTTDFITKEHTLSAFESLDLRGVAHITFHIDSTSTPHIRLRSLSDVLNRLEISVNDSTLRLHDPIEEALGETDFMFVDIYAPSIRNIAAEGSVTLEMDSLTLGNDLHIAAAGGSCLKSRSLTCPSLSIAVSGAADINLHQITTQQFNVAVAGAANVLAVGQCQDTEIKVSGAGNVDIKSLKVTGKKSIEVSGVGNVDQ